MACRGSLWSVGVGGGDFEGVGVGGVGFEVWRRNDWGLAGEIAMGWAGKRVMLPAGSVTAIWAVPALVGWRVAVIAVSVGRVRKTDARGVGLAGGG